MTLDLPSDLRTVWMLALPGLLIALAGCMDQEQADLTGTVQGRVTFGGEPVTYGTIIFHNEREGVIASMRLDGDGQYLLRFAGGDEIPVGEYVVTVVPPDSLLLAVMAGETMELDDVDSLPELEAAAAPMQLAPSERPPANSTDAATPSDTTVSRAASGALSIDDPKHHTSSGKPEVSAESSGSSKPAEPSFRLPPDLEAARAGDFPMIPHQFRSTSTSPLKVTVTSGENQFSIDLEPGANDR